MEDSEDQSIFHVLNIFISKFREKITDIVVKNRELR